MLKIGFIGAGTTGTALAVRLSQRGYEVVAASSRSFSSAQKLAARIPGCNAYHTAQEVADKTQLTFITTPDDVIAKIASEIKWHDGQYVVHCSGVHSIDILKHAETSGGHTGCFHPLQTFASIDHAIDNLPGSTFGIEAQDSLLSILKDMANDLEGNWIILKPGDKVLYHAAAVFTSNYFVTLVKLSTDLWRTFGIPQEQAVKALAPLIKGTLHNIETVGLPDCLTGPIARGDSGTIKKHLDALRTQVPAAFTIYKELGRQTLPIALAKGKIDTRQISDLQAILS